MGRPSERRASRRSPRPPPPAPAPPRAAARARPPARSPRRASATSGRLGAARSRRAATANAMPSAAVRTAFILDSLFPRGACLAIPPARARSMNTSSSVGTIAPHARERDVARRERALDRDASRLIAGAHVQAIAEELHAIARRGWRAATSSARRAGVATTSRIDAARRRLQPRRLVEREPPALVEQHDARAALGLVEVRRRQHESSDPAPRNSASSFQNSRRETGSTPVVGSSSTRIGGSCTSVQASASFCFMPPDSRSASRRAERLESGQREQPRAARREVADAVDRARRTRCSRRSTDRRRG